MASPTKSTNTRAGRSSSKMSFDCLVKSRNKIKGEPSNAVLPPKNQKRKAVDTIDLSSPKKVVITSPVEAKAVVAAPIVVSPPKAPGDFDTVSNVVIEYLRIGRAQIDEALIRAAEAEKRAFDLSTRLSAMEEKASNASKLEEELSLVKTELLESKGELATKKDALAQIEADLMTKSDALTKVEIELSDIRKHYADLRQSQTGMVKTHAEMAMDLATFFGQQARLELFEAFFAGKTADWNLDQAREIVEKDFPEGCPHQDWLEKAGVINPEGDVESSGRNDDAGALKEDSQDVTVDKPAEDAKGGESKE
ncbi:hypothetical protein V2J09_000723 [Rumex salicifolius]